MNACSDTNKRIRCDSTVLWTRVKVKTKDMERIYWPELCQQRQLLCWPIHVPLTTSAGTGIGACGKIPRTIINKELVGACLTGRRLRHSAPPSKDMPVGQEMQAGVAGCLIVLVERVRRWREGLGKR